MLKKSKNLDKNNLDRNPWKIVHFDTFGLHRHLGAKTSYNMGGYGWELDQEYNIIYGI